MTSEFKCSICGLIKAEQSEGGTGYAVLADESKVCYECCAILDRDSMIKTGRATLYLTIADYGKRGWLGERYISASISNWPGTLKFHSNLIKYGRHNMADRRYDVWFYGPDGKTWHGVRYGDNTQICHCKRTKD
jgi:hypothetical protein